MCLAKPKDSGEIFMDMKNFVKNTNVCKRIVADIQNL